MKALEEEIKKRAVYMGNGIIRADGFINHQLIPGFTKKTGEEFKDRFTKKGVTGITKIVTAEVSGIAFALAAGQAFGVPAVFARKKKPAFMTGKIFSASAVSRTKSGAVTLHVSADYLTCEDRVIIIDDFLATASTIKALVSIIDKSRAKLLGIGCIIEKCFEKGRDVLESLNVPVITLARIDIDPLKENLKIIRL